MLIKKIIYISKQIKDYLENILKINIKNEYLSILPPEGINSIYYQNPPIQCLKISFIFNKRIFLDDNEKIEKNDIFSDIFIVEEDLQDWLKKTIQKENFPKPNVKIYPINKCFNLFMEFMEIEKQEKRSFQNKNIKIHPTSQIHNSVNIGDNVNIGENTIIYPNVVIYDNVYIGNNVIIHSNSVIGADGYGYIAEDKIIKIPQEGGVVIKDNVEIGSCTCIDRATLGYTYIGNNTKIDNIVQIGHNVKIGNNCRIAGKSGVAGSARIYDNSIIAAMAGVKDGIKIGPNSILAGASMATKSIPPNQVFAGNPARPISQFLKDLAKRS